MGKRKAISALQSVITTVVVFLVACGNLPSGSGPAALASLVGFSATPSLTPFQPEGYVAPTSTTAPLPGQPNPTSVPASLWISPAVPDSLRQFALTPGLPLAPGPETASLHLDLLDPLDPQSSITNPQSSIWYYALVAPFPTIPDDVTLADIQHTWFGMLSGSFAGRSLWVDAPTLAAFTALWGPSTGGLVRVAPADQLVDLVWADRPALAIIPFEAMEPRWKVLSVDGQSPVHNDFDPAAYPLKLGFSLQPAAFPLPPSNRDPDKLTVLAMTGTTALVRATADRMEKHGVLYPGEEVRSVLRAADLTHVSNEVAFDPDCPTPDPDTGSMAFCSDPRYIALLEDVGVDIVELTGNHLLDYGPADLLATLDMYDQRGWSHFGGGRDLADALKPLLLEHHGNKLAFIGCNIAGPPGDWATGSRPGSTPCDLDQMAAEITSLRGQGYLPVVTFQYGEYYQAAPGDQEQVDFRKMADAGAYVVSGSQAHMPATLEFYRGAFVHYGLGNLFFDQMSHLMPDGSVIYDTRNVFIDRHIFYAGRYIGTELLSYIIEDYSRPRLMTDAERSQFLKHIFSVGGW